MADRDAQLDQAEDDFADAVGQALTATADEFADAVRDATELVAARFSVGQIARMWQSRVSGLVRRLLGISETAARAAADDAGSQLPDGWDDLPGRYDDDRPLPDGIGQYVETTEHLLRAVGDRLADATRRELAAGLDAGEDTEQLRSRLRAAFSREGAQLGDARENRIALTEATRAWNAATLAAAKEITGPDRPLVKQWLCVLPDTPITASGVVAASRRHYSGPVVRLDSAAGRRVTLTPEHEVLTTRGWLPAKALNKGDRLIQVGSIQPVGAPQVENPPAKIGEVVDAAMTSGPVEVRSMAASVDLDGNLPNGQVEVVVADRGLAQHFEPRLGQGTEDVFLVNAHVLGELAVLADGRLLGSLRGERITAAGGGQESLAAPLLGALSGSPNTTGSAPIAERHASLAEQASDCRFGSPVPLSQSCEACPGFVSTDDIRDGEVITAQGSDSDCLCGAGLHEAGGITVECEPGRLGLGTKGYASGSKATLHRHGRRSHDLGDLGGALSGLVPADHLVNVRRGRNIGIGGSSALPDDRSHSICAHAERLGDEVDLFAGVEATQDLRDVLAQRVGGLPGIEMRAERHTGLGEAAADRPLGSTEVCRKLVDARSALVETDELIDVEVLTWDGHVYDLSTDTGWYAADGLVIHNSRRDDRVRDAHAAVNGQIQLLDDPFVVAGVRMSAPGDPTAPPALTVNCRCVLRLQRAPDREASVRPPWATDRARAMATAWDRPRYPNQQTPAAYESQVASPPGFSEPRESSVETPESVTAAGGYTGAMIALMPTPEDAERLALATDDAEPAHELHLTLFYLGDGADWSEEARDELIVNVRNQAQEHGLADGPVYGRAFGANQWNADSSEPCWVWAVGDDRDAPDYMPRLESARWAAVYALEGMHRQPELPTQHSPWQAHVCAAYSGDSGLLDAMNERLGPIRFDRIRVAFAGEHVDISLGPEEEATPMDNDEAETNPWFDVAPWSTPGNTGLAFEDEETGDGRVFRPGSLYWSGGPWPLQYADEMLMGHEGAELAGAIQNIGRDGDRITGTGVLYPGRPAGADALMLLEQESPLGVSVDLDDVSVEFVDRTADGDEDQEEEVILLASLPSASMLRLDDGSWAVTTTVTNEWTASGASLSRTTAGTQLLTGPGGRVSAAAVHAALAPTGTLTAAAGDRDTDIGTVVHSESSGDLLMRVTRARLRGATLVAMPAYDRARIVLDDPTDATAATVTAAGPSEAHLQVVAYVKASPMPVGARDVARALGMKMETARGHLARAAKADRIVRLARGLYIGPIIEGPDLAASASGDLDLPVHDNPDRTWDGDAARSRVLAWATDDNDQVDPDKLAAAFLYRDDEADPATVSAYKLPFADVINDRLEIVAAGVYTIASVLQGGMGGVDLPDDDREAIRGRVETLYARIADAYDDPSITPPWSDGDEETAAAGLRELEASAWTAMRDADPMPAAWFAEPTAEELPPGSGGVHYKNGRVYGWVARKGVPHAGYPGKKLTIEKLAKQGIDLSEFLRARFRLDDGTTVKVGAFTMNVGHHRDGAECETAVCQFDDSRTVAGVITVGMNEGGMWFSGAAAPWLSEWDRTVFQACQPSYHLKEAPGGRGWKLGAVLSVPVPGHPSPLLATAVAERANLALAASAAGALTASDAPGQLADTAPDVPGSNGPDLRGQRPDSVPDTVPDSIRRALRKAPPASRDVDAVAASLLTSVPFVDALLTAMDRRQEQREAAAREEVQRLAASVIAPAREDIAVGHTADSKGAA